MAWVGWVGREGRGEVDREEAVRRLGVALDRWSEQVEQRPTRLPRPRQRSTGVALRRTPPGGSQQPDKKTRAGQTRRAS
jgi:hypothetical protein